VAELVLRSECLQRTDFGAGRDSLAAARSRLLIFPRGLHGPSRCRARAGLCQMEIRFALFLCTLLAAYVPAASHRCGGATRDENPPGAMACCAARSWRRSFLVRRSVAAILDLEVLPTGASRSPEQTWPPKGHSQNPMAQPNHAGDPIPAMAARVRVYLAHALQRVAGIAAVCAFWPAGTGDDTVQNWRCLCRRLIIGCCSRRPHGGDAIQHRWFAAGRWAAMPAGVIALRWWWARSNTGDTYRRGHDATANGTVEAGLGRSPGDSTGWEVGVGTSSGYGQLLVAPSGPIGAASNGHNLICNWRRSEGGGAIGAVAVGL